MFCHGANMDGTIINMFAGKAVAKLSKLPSEYGDQVYFGSHVSPEVLEIHRELGLDHLMWGADFPHHEGTAPRTLSVLRGTLSAAPEREVRQILGQSAADLYGADMEFLQGVADGVGPTPAEVANPLRPEEIPDDLNFLMLLGSGAGFSAFNRAEEH
jgi:hypothetical protein